MPSDEERVPSLDVEACTLCGRPLTWNESDTLKAWVCHNCPGTPSEALDVEACVRLLDDLIVMLAPHDAQSIADANQLRALASALPGMGKDSETLRRLRDNLLTVDAEARIIGDMHKLSRMLLTKQGVPRDRQRYAAVVNAAAIQIERFDEMVRAAQPQETSADASQDCYACGHARAQHLNESNELDDCLDCHCSEFMQSPASSPSPERPE